MPTASPKHQKKLLGITQPIFRGLCGRSLVKKSTEVRELCNKEPPQRLQQQQQQPQEPDQQKHSNNSSNLAELLQAISKRTLAALIKSSTAAKPADFRESEVQIRPWPGCPRYSARVLLLCVQPKILPGSHSFKVSTRMCKAAWITPLKAHVLTQDTTAMSARRVCCSYDKPVTVQLQESVTNSLAWLDYKHLRLASARPPSRQISRKRSPEDC